MIELRGKQLHPRMAQRVIKLWIAKFYEEAILNSFKVVEERMREITGVQEEALKLIDHTFNVNTGLLTNPNSWRSEREGVHLFFRGAFLSFRNRPAHSFTDPNEEEAFDLIILANSLLTIIEKAYQRKQQDEDKAAKSFAVYKPKDYGQYLDIDSDGKDELIVVEDKKIEVFRISNAGLQPIDVQPFNFEFMTLGDVEIFDVDNDSVNELICVVHWDTDAALVLYKYKDGKMEILPKILPKGWDFVTPYFGSGFVGDLNGDNDVEVTSESYGEVPEYLIPHDYAATCSANGNWGRVKYVWKWNNSLQGFECIAEELLHIGKGRFA